MTGEQSQRPPYPGLRAFRREETDLFFGREDCTNAMVDRLARTRFLAVLGSSGTGKSSLVRTGLLDALELGLMAKAGSRWKIVDFRPGGSPLKNLARRLLETQSGEENPNIAPQDVDLLRAFLARGPRAVIEWCRSGNLPKGGNLLLLVDQFEELFRYQDYAGREEAEAFVALLLESAREPDAPIYVTITMRSEYLGACALIEGLSDAINAGMFLTPRMSRDHCRDAIVGPAEVCNIDIEPALVNRLLNDLANFAPWDDHDAHDQLDRLMRRADQLPLLQYTLNRMWQRAHERSPGARVKLTVDDYVAIEGLGGALNAHANQIFEDLGKPRAQVAEWVFRALTAGSTLADAVRRPTRLDELIAACGGDEAGVRAVVDAFRAPGVNFLLPEFDPHNPKIAPDTYIDISHESSDQAVEEALGMARRRRPRGAAVAPAGGPVRHRRHSARPRACEPHRLAHRNQAERSLGPALWRRLSGGHRLSRQEPARSEHQTRGGACIDRCGIHARRRVRRRRDLAAQHHRQAKRRAEGAAGRDPSRAGERPGQQAAGHRPA